MSESSTQQSAIQPLIPRRRTLALGALWAATASLNACGGGDSPVAVIPGGGGTGTLPPSPGATPSPTPGPTAGASITTGSVFGVVTALSPLTVCATAWQVPATATLQLEDPEVEGLRLGMIVRVNGMFDATASVGVATEIASRPVLRGAVESVNTSGFTVSGVRVSTDYSTVFADLTGLVDLKVGDAVQVHGHLRPSFAASGSQVSATRIRRATQPLQLGRVSGVARLGTGALTYEFTLNSSAFSAAASTFGSQLPQPLRDGSLVHVVFDTRSAAPITVATEITAHLQSLAVDANVRMQGQIYAGLDGALRINDLAITFADSVPAAQRVATTQIVQVTGQIRTGVLTVNDVRGVP